MLLSQIPMGKPMAAQAKGAEPAAKEAGKEEPSKGDTKQEQ